MRSGLTWLLLMNPRVLEKLADITMVVSVGIHNNRFAFQARKLLFVFGEFKLASLVPVDLLPLGSVYV